MEGDVIGYSVGGLGLVSLIAQGIWNKVFSTEGKSHDLLVQQLTERIASQEQRLLNLESGLDDERRLRRQAEDKVQALEFYVVLLKAELQKHGIEVPKPDFDEYKAGGTD